MSNETSRRRLEVVGTVPAPVAPHEPRVTGCAQRLLVHGDVAGSILRTRLTRSLGRIDPEIARRIVLRGCGVDFNSTDLGRGRPITDDSDPRWEAKMQRVEQLRRVKARASELGLRIAALRP